MHVLTESTEDQMEADISLGSCHCNTARCILVDFSRQVWCNFLLTFLSLYCI